MRKLFFIVPIVGIISFIGVFLVNKNKLENKIIDNILVETSVNPGIESQNIAQENHQVLGDTTDTTSFDNENLTTPSPKFNVQEENEGEEDINTSQETSKSIDFEISKLYSLINSYRKDNGLSPLNIDQSLQISAKRKIEDMIENNYFRHQDTGNVESWYLFRTAGYEFTAAGENLSSGNNTPWQVFEAWKESPVHDEQLKKDVYRDMGLAVDCESYKDASKPSCIVVLHLGAR